jgi:hypothetical protein
VPWALLASVSTANVSPAGAAPPPQGRALGSCISAASAAKALVRSTPRGEAGPGRFALGARLLTLRRPRRYLLTSFEDAHGFFSETRRALTASLSSDLRVRRSAAERGSFLVSATIRFIASRAPADGSAVVAPPPCANADGAPRISADATAIRAAPL